MSIRPGSLILCIAASFWLWPLVLVSAIARRGKVCRVSERDYRISGRDWEPLTDERIEEILDDTGSDRPNDDYCAAEVYALAREVRDRRRMAAAADVRNMPHVKPGGDAA